MGLGKCHVVTCHAFMHPFCTECTSYCMSLESMPQSLEQLFSYAHRAWYGYVEGNEDGLQDAAHPFRSSHPWASFAAQGKLVYA